MSLAGGTYIVLNTSRFVLLSSVEIECAGVLDVTVKVRARLAHIQLIKIYTQGKLIQLYNTVGHDINYYTCVRA